MKRFFSFLIVLIILSLNVSVVYADSSVIDDNDVFLSCDDMISDEEKAELKGTVITYTILIILSMVGTMFLAHAIGRDGFLSILVIQISLTFLLWFLLYAPIYNSIYTNILNKATIVW